MGLEARCTARFGDSVSEGKALLETDELVFRGDFRLKIPFKEMRSVEAADGRLDVTFGKATATFELGAQAERWADKIRNPKSLLDKLGVKDGMRIRVLDVEHPELRRLAARDGEADAVFVGVESRDELPKIEELRSLLAPAGALWIVAPKGRKDPTEMDVLTAGRAAGLTDTKVVRFSETHTAHKFVVPRAAR